MAAVTEKEPDGSERRVAPRMRVLKRAKIVFNNGFSTFDCVVRNISATGALLTLAESAHMPKEFQIKVGEEGGLRPARLVYRRAMFAGIRFLDIPDEQGGPVKTAAPAPVPAPAPAAAPTLVETAQPPAGGGRQAAPATVSENGIAKIRPATLPPALRRHFSWK